MKLIAFILFASTTTAFAQNQLKGTWTLYSYKIDDRETEIKDKTSKEKLRFDEDGSYERTYYGPELPEGAQLQMSKSFSDKKMTLMYFDKDGNEIKGVRVRKKTEYGTYQRINSSERIRFETKKEVYDKICRIEGKDLVIADTVNSKIIFNKYRKRT